MPTRTHTVRLSDHHIDIINDKRAALQTIKGRPVSFTEALESIIDDYGNKQRSFFQKLLKKSQRSTPLKTWIPTNDEVNKEMLETVH